MKKISVIVLALLLAFNLLACTPQNEAPAETTAAKTEATTAAPATEAATTTAAEQNSYTPFSVMTFQDKEVTFDHVPERVVSFNLHTTENLLALGLGDKMVGRSYDNAEVLPEFKEEYDKIVQLAEKYPAFEVLLGADPDFVYGRSSAFGEKGVGSVQTFLDNDIMPYVSKATYTAGATMEDTFADFETLGKIFAVEDRAEGIINDMKAQIKMVEDALAGQGEKLKVFVYDAGTDDAFTAGQSLESDIIEKAGGHNVFSNIEKTWVSVSWEEVVESNPDVIVINDYGSTSADDKIKMLKENAALAGVKAIKDDRFVVLPLPSVFTGIRNGDAIEYLARQFYPDVFDSVGKEFKPFSVVTFEDKVVNFDHVPERVVSFNLHTTENLLALGLGDKMVGRSYDNAEVLPEFKEEYDKVEQLAEKYPAFEVLLGADPDFVYGRSSAFGEKGVGSVQTFLDNDIMPYVSKATYTAGATMEDTFADFETLGKIFNVEDRAEAIINDMKAQIKMVEDKLAGKNKKLKVFVYDAGTDDAFTAGQSLESDIIEKAGGHNVFSDIEKTWVSVSWEEVVESNPDVIVINDYGSTSADEKIKMLKENPALSGVNAVKYNRFVVLPLPSVFTGIRNGDAIEYLAKQFYPRVFR